MIEFLIICVALLVTVTIGLIVAIMIHLQRRDKVLRAQLTSIDALVADVGAVRHRLDLYMTTSQALDLQEIAVSQHRLASALETALGLKPEVTTHPVATCAHVSWVWSEGKRSHQCSDCGVLGAVTLIGDDRERFDVWKPGEKDRADQQYEEMGADRARSEP